jgi:prepilin-type N-terminal cleavage/methylation domain-containing protein
MKTQSPSQSRKAFTILELIIVIGVLAVLMAILIPSLSYVKAQSKKASTVALLNSIGIGLEQYYTDHNMYPPSNPLLAPAYPKPPATPFDRGGLMLTQGLTGYLTGSLDGAGDPQAADAMYKGDPSLGFRTRPQTGTAPIGKVYGPYIEVGGSHWKVISPEHQVLIDLWGNEILYFRAGPELVNGRRRNIQRIFQDPFTSFPAYFIALDNRYAYKQAAVSAANPTGEVKLTSAEMPSNPAFLKLLGGAMPGETILGHNSYLLVSAGPDGIYFTADDIIHAGK